MIAVIAKLTTVEGKEDVFKEAAQKMVAAVKANEAGRTLHYTCAQNKDKPQEFFFLELYADDAAAGEHGKSAHMAEFGKSLPGVVAGRPEITRLDVVAALQ